ncbi:hypothetical protein BH11CYA1_BH11CYA1_15880 [soil metagenome]
MVITGKASIYKAFTISLIACLAVVSAVSPVCAREQWQMQHPEGPPPTGPVGKGWVPPAPGSVPGLVGSGQASSTGMAPGLMAPGLGAPSASEAGVPDYGGRRQIPDEVIQQMLVSRVGAGSVLTGVLGDELSSKKSQAGDLFSIVLRDGHSQNGHELIPRGSRIIGKVVRVSAAATLRTAMPGNVEVGLTTLVFPDGRSIPFTGMIERNPAHTMKKPPVSRGPGMSMSDYAGSVTSMLGSFTSGIGAVRARTNRGRDFLLHEGESIPVRVGRTLDLTKMSPPTAPPSQALSNPFENSAQMPPINNGAPLYSPNAAPINMAPQSHSQMPILPKELPDPF